jgi:hypothetical protein
MLMRSGSPRALRSAVHNWPSPKDGLSELQVEAAMKGFLHATGWDGSDFVLRIDPAPLPTRPNRPRDRILTVRRQSTGHERLYYAGPFSSWLAQLLQDVEQGIFGARRRS